jgi:phage recombination protein Bet
MSNNALVELTNKLSTTLGMGANGVELYNTLKATAFKGQVSDAQMTALLVVANQYSLNPWTKEIYAFPDKSNGIVPIVGVDGWSRIINSHPQFDGMEFEQDEQGCTCIIYRKDRQRPIKVTEWMDECKRGTAPWQSHPKRMLRHKAMIQCARIAFGFVGIYDEDEASRISEAQEKPVQAVVIEPVALPAFEQSSFESKLPAYKGRIEAGKPAQEVVSFLQTKYTLTDGQIAAILALESDGVIDIPASEDAPF